MYVLRLKIFAAVLMVLLRQDQVVLLIMPKFAHCATMGIQLVGLRVLLVHIHARAATDKDQQGLLLGAAVALHATLITVDLRVSLIPIHARAAMGKIIQVLIPMLGLVAPHVFRATAITTCSAAAAKVVLLPVVLVPNFQLVQQQQIEHVQNVE